MGLFATKRRGTDESFPKSDRGMGHLDDYSFGLIVESGDSEFETAISPRSIVQERTDEPIQVRLFTGRRVSGPVGSVPRGMEAIVDETLRRLDDTVGTARIPVRITQKSGRYRVELLMGAVR
jgi:hypothetical protein